MTATRLPHTRRVVSPCVAAGGLFTVRTVIMGSYALVVGLHRTGITRPLHLHRISSVGETCTHWNGS